ncbi:MAG: hypothetical protein KY445_05435 [Armatimonadetes bacterium]|nr:hypothetical protein [Armatimonadota bacterium]
MARKISFTEEVYFLYGLFVSDAHGFRVKERYHHLVCAECGRVDSDKALAEGIDFARKPPQAPVLSTGDHFVLMNEQGRAVFESIYGEAVRFQDVENREGVFIASPVKIIRPALDAPVYAVGASTPENEVLPAYQGRCGLCRRAFTVSVKAHRYRWEEGDTLVALQADTGRTPILVWMTTDEKAAQLKAAGLPSVRIIAHDMVLDYAGAVPRRVEL